jgi:hypothetical protein
MASPRVPAKEICSRICRQCRTYSRRSRPHQKKPSFPHGFSTTEHLVPPSADGSTPITDALPRSVLLDPTAYESKIKHRQAPPKKDTAASLSVLEKLVEENPFGISMACFVLLCSKNSGLKSPIRQHCKS